MKINIYAEKYRIVESIGTKYKVLKRVGAGGISEVFLVEDRETKKNLALKLFFVQSIPPKLSLEEFKKISEKTFLNLEKEVSIYDYGEEDLRKYFVRDYIEGTSLKNFIPTKDEISESYLLNISKIIKNISKKIVEIHKISFHGNLKPENIIISENNLVTLVDFSIPSIITIPKYRAIQLSQGDAFYYMAPEYIYQGMYITKYVDIYSFGVIVYQLLTGTLPDRKNYKKPSEINKFFNNEIDNIFTKILSRNPNERYRNSDEFTAELITSLENSLSLKGKIITLCEEDLDDIFLEPSGDENEISVQRNTSITKEEKIENFSTESKDGTLIIDDNIKVTGLVIHEYSSPIIEETFSYNNNIVIEGEKEEKEDKILEMTKTDLQIETETTKTDFPIDNSFKETEVKDIDILKPSQESTITDYSFQISIEKSEAKEQRVFLPAKEDVANRETVAEKIFTTDKETLSNIVRTETFYDLSIKDITPPYFTKISVLAIFTIIIGLLGIWGFKYQTDSTVALFTDIIISGIKEKFKKTETHFITSEERSSNDISLNEVIRSDSESQEESFEETSKNEAVESSIQEQSPPIISKPPSSEIIDKNLVDIEELKKKADEYFSKEWITSPKDQNVVAVCNRILEKDVENQYAKEKILQAVDKYIEFGKSKFNVKDYNKAKMFYEKSLEIISNFPWAQEKKEEVIALLSSLDNAKNSSDKLSYPPNMVLIPAGIFYMGSDKNDPLRNSIMEEKENVPINLPPFLIDKYEYPNELGEFPKVDVRWDEAKKLCELQGKRLCTEEEWEKACKGIENTRFPYGNTWDKTKCNSEDAQGNDRLPVTIGTNTQCVSSYGVYDLSGNVREWTSSSFPNNPQEKIVKGGSSSDPDWASRCANRENFLPEEKGDKTGFRCCKDL